jgi:hypothetical protein
MIRMEEKIIIGLTGKKGSGKSTVADYLKEQYNFTEYAFADKLKTICMEVFGLNYKQVYGTPLDKERIDDFWNVSPRVIMQEVGTAFRNIEKSNSDLNKIWIKSLHREINMKKHNLVVISDIRYPDEIESIHEYKKKDWKVLIINIQRNEISDDLHESETQILDSDIIIENNSTRKNLFLNIDDILIRELHFIEPLLH